MAELQEMKVEIIKREAIKPSRETPKHLKTLTFSLLDQIATYHYASFVLFYTNNNKQISPNDRVQRLRETLPETLSLFYPLAGRLIFNENLFVDCNNGGAEFVEAKLPTRNLSDILRKPDQKALENFIPAKTDSAEPILGGYLLRVQVTVLGCGGMVVGICVSNKIFDDSFVGTFLKAWAEIARGEPVKMMPRFGNGSALFPPVPGISVSVEPAQPKSDLLWRRYVFEEGTKIEALKNKCTSPNYSPTRVEAISALLWRVMIRTTSSSYEKSVWTQVVVSLRKKLVSRLRDEDFGNMAMNFFATTDNHNKNNNNNTVSSLVRELGKGFEDLMEGYSGLDEDRYMKMARKNFEDYARLSNNGDEAIEFYKCSSLCGTGLYDVDFGWEKPKWVSLVGKVTKNMVYLMDSGDGRGIEAWVSVRECDVNLVESDDELLSFASINRSVVKTGFAFRQIKSRL